MFLQKKLAQSAEFRRAVYLAALIGLLLIASLLILWAMQEAAFGIRMLLLLSLWGAAALAYSFGRLSSMIAARTAQLDAANAAPDNVIGSDSTSRASLPSQTPRITDHLSARQAHSLSAITHDLRTPINLIVGFCETMIGPVHPYQQPLPTSYRNDLEAIYRNAKYLQQAVENVLSVLKTNVNAPTASAPSAPPVPAQPSPSATAMPPSQKCIIVLDDDPTVVELFRRHITQFEIIGSKTVRDLELLAADREVAAVLLTNEHSYTQIPEIPHITGRPIPIITCAVPGERRLPEIRRRNAYLTKPITFQALSSAFEQFGVPIHDILIIDDNRDNVEMITRMIESIPQAYHIWKTYSGREGLTLLYEQRPDVIILDRFLPDMDGSALTQYLRTDPQLASIPVLMVSAYHDPALINFPLVSKLSVLQLAGFQLPDLAHTIETLVELFGLSSQV